MSHRFGWNEIKWNIMPKEVYTGTASTVHTIYTVYTVYIDYAVYAVDADYLYL